MKKQKGSGHVFRCTPGIRKKNLMKILEDCGLGPDECEKEAGPRFRFAGNRAWKGKSLIIDFDDTLVTSEHLGYLKGGEVFCSEKNVVTTEFRGRRYGFRIARINEDAKEFLDKIRKSEAKAFIASASDEQFLESAVGIAGFRERFDGIFAWQQLVYLTGKRRGVSPKDLTPIIEATEEKDPLANWLMIGNDPRSDIPKFPEGLVTAIGDIDQVFRAISLKLRMLLGAADGNIAKGFDTLYDGGIRNLGILGGAELVRLQDWKYDKRTTGLARIINFGTEDRFG